MARTTYEGLTERVVSLCNRLGLPSAGGPDGAFAILFDFAGQERDDERDHAAELLETQAHGLHIASKLVKNADDIGQMAFVIEACAMTVRQRTIEEPQEKGAADGK